MNRAIWLIVILVFCKVLSAQVPGSGNSIFFDGIDDRVTYDNLFEGLDLPLTVSYWLKISSNHQSFEPIFSSCYVPSNTYYGFTTIYYNDGIDVQFGDGRGALNPNYRRSKTYNFPQSMAERWVHVALVIRGSTSMDIFINGVMVSGSYSGAGNPVMAVISSCNTIIGFNSNNGGNHFFNGFLDELRVWNYARSSAEIRSDMCRRLNGNESGLVGYWKFDEDSGTSTQEIVSGSDGAVEGSAVRATSGAPIGDESFPVYFTAGSKEKMKFKNELDSFWISSTNSKWEGYQIYKVNQSPNTSNGSTLSLDDGYYGVFPIFSQGAQGEFRLDLGTPYCSIGDFRFGNDDSTWEPIVSQSDTSLFITSNATTEFVFLDGSGFHEISQNYHICLGESLIIDAFDNCVLSYSWNNASVESELEVSESGAYWVDRTTLAGTFRSYFNVQLVEVISDVISEETIQLCPSDLPFQIELENVNVVSWSNGQAGNSIEIEEAGTYTVNFQTACGIMSDEVSIIVEELDVLVPNVFTPNGDDVNDCFKIGEGLLGSSLLVVNRAGVIVFEDVNYQNNWCMPSIESGIYFYHLQNNCFGKELKGWVQVLK